LILSNDDVAATIKEKFPIPKLNKICLLCQKHYDPRYNGKPRKREKKKERKRERERNMHVR
jgi:hypothetical protein